ncbi:MAG TPA: demethoxyubiquinone hydroxylase family protein [Gammaproteobacteria bacterium]|nr:demethoxyubiquinone hydroxylase family protein [Gammaproteobacteria bacterium]
MSTRHYSPFDHLVQGLDQALRTTFGPAPDPSRPNPADALPEAELSASERELAGRLMRINHAGEISAQALYQGQALTARLPTVRVKMEQAAVEENDHLAWTEDRIRELGTHTTILAPLWYAGSFAIGALAGLAGDKWSLGFVVETERQVIRHLDSHLAQLPEQDARDRAILETMKADEAHHATTALGAGAAELPVPARQLMALTSKVMTTAAYWI